MRSEHFESLVSSFVNGTMKLERREKVEQMIASDANLNEIYLRKVQEKDFLRQLIPDKKIAKNNQSFILNEIKKVNEEIYPVDKMATLRRIYKYLTEPVVEIEY